MLLGCYSSEEKPPEQVFQISKGLYPDDDDFDNVSQEMYHTAEITIDFKRYSLVDTIGIPESSTSDVIWNKLKKIENKSSEGVVAYIFVLEGGRLTQHELLFISKLFTRYPNTRIIVVFTKVPKSLVLSRIEMEKTFNTQILTLLYGIKNRWIVMPSLDSFGHNDQGKIVIKDFVDELKKKIMEVRDENVRKEEVRLTVRGETSATIIGRREKLSYISVGVCVIIVISIIVILSLRDI
ncbi:2398_t:CDS:2 [Funneliformis geosporum]|uniref:2398_t:CDS:1 n=1 Tax=Funneliformis geosporum TaxID=1117311 RepID=A0A9W4SY18_9GLOM|nr:2398_t:CDS:2 [Funneliformis geosporum]